MENISQESTSTESCPSGTVISFKFSNRDTDSAFVVMFRGMRIRIYIFERDLESSPKVLQEYRRFLEVAEAGGDLDGLPVEDLYNWVLDACSQEFSQLPPSALPSTPTLADWLFPIERHYTMLADESHTIRPVEHIKDPVGHLPPGARVRDELTSLWPAFTASQVIICANNPEDVLSRSPSKVRIEGHDLQLFFKPYHRGQSRSAKHELQTHTQIVQANLSDLQISQLFGIVRDESGNVLGLLLYYIDCEYGTLEHAVSPEVTSSRRQHWAAQITAGLSRLHEAGIVWSDAKAANVLVDRQDDAWIIDFGGGQSDGWVKRDLAGTVQGDEQGLSKILDYINSGVDSLIVPRADSDIGEPEGNGFAEV